MANRYWVGGTATWDNTAGTKWALTSGGAGGQAVPTSSDDVFFDANSGAVTVTHGSPGGTCRNLDHTGFTGTIAFNGDPSIYGNLILGSGMTMTTLGGVNIGMVATSGTVTVKSNGKAFITGLIFVIRCPGATVQLLDDLVLGTGNGDSVNIQQGTFDANNFNVTSGRVADSVNGVAKIILMGSGTWTLTSTQNGATPWALQDTGFLTITPGTSTIKYTGNDSNPKYFIGGGLTYYDLWFSRGASSGDIGITDSNTFHTFKDDGSVAHNILFTAGTTTHFTTWSVSGTAGNLKTLNSTTTATFALVKDGGGTVSADYLNIQHSVATPSSTFYAGVNSTNNQATATAGSGWIFTVPPDFPSVSDSVTVTENVTIKLPILPISISDLVTITENINPIIQVTKLVFDSVTVSENIALTIGFQAITSDNVAITENFTIKFVQLVPSAFDLVTITENISIVIPVLVLSIYDSVTITENISIKIPLPISVSDSVTVSENIAAHITDQESVSESITVSENVNMKILSLVNVFDAVSVAENYTFIRKTYGYGQGISRPRGVL